MSYRTTGTRRSLELLEQLPRINAWFVTSGRPAPLAYRTVQQHFARACTSRKPDTSRGLQTLRNAINQDYDAWYAIHDSDALGRELEKAIKGWLFDRGVNSHTLYRLYAWVRYYEGDRPPIIAELDQGVG